MQPFDVKSHKKDFDELKDYMDQVGPNKGQMMSILNYAQDIFGYLPVEVQEFVSEYTGVPLSDIYGVVTFYSNFSMEPKGDYHISVCLGTSCYVNGSQKIIKEFEDQLGIKLGETSDDDKYTLTDTRCIGACGLSPTVSVNDTIYGRFTLDDVSKIIAETRK